MEATSFPAPPPHDPVGGPADEVGRAVAAIEAAGLGGPYSAAIVTGTGLGGLIDLLTHPVGVDYEDIPGFPRSGVSGHHGRLVAGELSGRKVLVMQGRSHYYERGDARVMRLPIAAVARLGVPLLLLSNAAGSTRSSKGPGSIAVITDHINFSGTNPLIGEEGDERFVPMSDAYDPVLRAALHRAAAAIGIDVHDAVYMWFSGPSFETPAEIRAAKALGADLVGMSTVPETILARRFGLRVAAVSIVTNLAAGVDGANPSHAETKQAAAEAATRFAALIRAFVGGLGNR